MSGAVIDLEAQQVSDAHWAEHQRLCDLAIAAQVATEEAWIARSKANRLYEEHKALADALELQRQAAFKRWFSNKVDAILGAHEEADEATP